MESFQTFDAERWKTDDSRLTLTAIEPAGNNKEVFTAYGGIPLRCDGQHSGVHDFQINILKKKGYIAVGIDQGRSNTKANLWFAKTDHYCLVSHGYFYQGITPSVIDVLNESIDLRSLTGRPLFAHRSVSVKMCQTVVK